MKRSGSSTRRRILGVLCGVALFACRTGTAATLQPQTLRAWQQYVSLTESRIQAELASEKGFFVYEFLSPSDASGARQTILSGSIFVRKMETRNEEGKKVDVPKGMVHHWVAGILIPGADLRDVLRMMQDYARFPAIFEEVEDARLLSLGSGDPSRIFLRLRRKSVVAVHYNTEHVVEFRSHGSDRASSRTEAIKIAQLEDPDTPGEREKLPGRDSGYLWRLNAYWRYKQEERGVVAECEVLSLSREIPAPMRWFIAPFTRSVPKQTLESTLEAVRRALGKGGGKRAMVTGRSQVTAITPATSVDLNR